MSKGRIQLQWERCSPRLVTNHSGVGVRALVCWRGNACVASPTWMGGVWVESALGRGGCGGCGIWRDPSESPPKLAKLDWKVKRRPHVRPKAGVRGGRVEWRPSWYYIWSLAKDKKMKQKETPPPATYEEVANLHPNCLSPIPRTRYNYYPIH